MSGEHLAGKTDVDVEQIWFHNGTMLFIPSGMGTIFNNVKSINIGDLVSLTSLGTKSIQRINFENFENLEGIAIVSSEIKKIDKDALWDLPNLQFFMAYANRLKFLNERTFERNPNLKRVAFISTELEEMPQLLFKYNLLLEYVAFYNGLIRGFSEQVFRSNGKLNMATFRSNKLEMIPANLFANNTLINDIDFSDNRIDRIYIDFRQFEHIEFIGFDLNECIDASYRNNSGNISPQYNNLPEFQKLISDNCQ